MDNVGIKSRPRIKEDGYRYIKDSDVKYMIESGNSKVDRYSLLEYLQWDKEGSYVIVNISDERPAAVMQLVVEEQCILLDMLSVDHRYQRQGIGTNLVFLAEKLTCELGKNLLKLESLDTSVEFYAEFGFRKLYLEQDSYWGTITHMEKQLSC